jgi:hypothetical protein
MEGKAASPADTVTLAEQRGEQVAATVTIQQGREAVTAQLY